MRIIGFAVAVSLCLAAAVARAERLTDPQIASIVVTADQVDIDAGKLAVSTSHTKDVKAFAERMITDHTWVNKSAVDLVTKLKVTPEDNPTSQSLKSRGEQNLSNFKSLRGATFDKAYVDHESPYHEQVLDVIDTVLIPNAKNAELKALLIQVRPAFVAHLEHAKRIQASLVAKS